MPLRNKTHILWDWNGTLIDDAILTYEIVLELISTYNQRQISFEEYRREFCIPVSEFYKRIGFDLNVASSRDMAHFFHDKYEGSRNRFELHRDVLDILPKITQSGRKQLILSAHPQAQIQTALEHFSIAHHFSTVLGATSNEGISKIAHGKAWYENSGLRQEELILIGDTDHDAEVADHLGIACILISNGHQDHAVLEKTGKKVLRNIRDLTALL